MREFCDEERLTKERNEAGGEVDSDGERSKESAEAVDMAAEEEEDDAAGAGDVSVEKGDDRAEAGDPESESDDVVTFVLVMLAAVVVATAERISRSTEARRTYSSLARCS